MNKCTTVILAAVALAFSVQAQAENPAEWFEVAIGASSFDTSLELASADEAAFASVGYRFNERLRADLTAPIQAYDSEFEQAGFGPLIQTEFRPYTLSLNYSLRPGEALNPFVGVGYTRFSVDPVATGVLTGLPMNAKAASGYTLRVGADYQFEGGWFVRGDVSATQSDLVIYAGSGGGSKILDEAMDPVSFSLGAGFRF